MVPTSATTKTFGDLGAMRWIKSIRKAPALLLGRHHDRVSETSKTGRGTSLGHLNGRILPSL